MGLMKPKKAVPIMINPARAEHVVEGRQFFDPEAWEIVVGTMPTVEAVRVENNTSYKMQVQVEGKSADIPSHYLHIFTLTNTTFYSAFSGFQITPNAEPIQIHNFTVTYASKTKIVTVNIQ